MPLHLLDDWSKIVTILAKPYVGLGDAEAQIRGADGEAFVLSLMRKRSFKAASYNSKTPADVWAVKKHICDRLSVSSIMLIQVKTSANNAFQFNNEARTALKTLTSKVHAAFGEQSMFPTLPRLRSNSRMVISSWLFQVDDSGSRPSLHGIEQISVLGHWAEGDSREDKDVVRQSVMRLCKQGLH